MDEESDRLLEIRDNHHTKQQPPSGHKVIHDIIFSLGSFLLFISCLILNILQLVNYLTVGFVSMRYYRKINAKIQYTIYSQMVAISEWWSKNELIIFYADEESRQNFGKESCLAVANHRYEMDPIFLWMICEKVNCLGNAKAFGKKELKYVPIVGWTFFFGEYIFLARNWEKDAKTLGPSLDKLMEYEDTVLLMIASEGTRFTKEKHESSILFAREKGLKSFKYHLLPRVRGFASTVRHLKENHAKCALYNIQLAIDEEAEIEPTISNFIKGLPTVGDFYVKRIPIETVPTDSDKELTDFLYNIYTEKDELMEYHKENGIFPGIAVIPKRSLLPLVVLWSNFILIGIPFGYILYRVFTSHNWLIISFTTVFIVAVYISIYLAIRSARIVKASNYGTFRGKDKPMRLISRTDALRKSQITGQTISEVKKQL